MCANYRKRRRKFVRKRPPTEVASVYEDTSYRRTVPKGVGGTSDGGYYGHQGASHHGGWYSGDYQSDFRSSHEYEDTSDNLYYEEGSRGESEESWVYRDIAFSDSDWSQRRQLKGLAPEEEEEDYYEY